MYIYCLPCCRRSSEIARVSPPETRKLPIWKRPFSNTYSTCHVSRLVNYSIGHVAFLRLLYSACRVVSRLVDYSHVAFIRLLQYEACRVCSITSITLYSACVTFIRLQYVSCRVYSITVRAVSRLVDYYSTCPCRVQSITVCGMSRLFNYSACPVAFSLLQYMCHVAFSRLYSTMYV